MAQQYEYLETSINYAENEGYEAQYEQFNNNVQDEQTFEAEVEAAEEQNIESETSKLRYQDADALIQTEIKEVIFKKETEKTTVSVLSKYKNNIMQQIKDLQKLTDIVARQNEALSLNKEIGKEEMLHLQKTVEYNGEIVSRLEEFMRTIENSFKQQKLRIEQYPVNLENQKSKILNCCTQSACRISQLRTDINNKKTVKDDVATDPNKTKNLLLKTKIIKQQEYLKHLKERYQQTEQKKENFRELINKKEQTENILKDKNIHLQTLKDDMKQIEENTAAFIKELQIKLEERTKSLTDSRQTLENINKEITEAIKVKDDLSKVISLKEDYSSQLDDKISKITIVIKDQQLAQDDYTEKCKEDIDTAQGKLKTLKNDLAVISNENYQLSSSLKLVSQEYFAKMEEKTNNLLLKLEHEKKLSSDEIILTNIKLLEEQITLKGKGNEELLKKIKKLSTDDALQDLNKKKAYLISSTDYLNEKLENVKTESENIKKVIEDVQADIDSIERSDQEKQEKYDALFKELQEQKSDAVDEYQLNTTPVSILKPAALSHKKLPVSPKKVQFEGLSSYESSVNSDPITLSGSNQPTISGKTFDDILEEIQAESFKEPLKLPKKRKLFLDIE